MMDFDSLGTASIEQTDLIEDTYQKKEGKSLKKLIEGEMGGDLEWAMLLRCENDEILFKITRKRGIMYQNHTKTRNFVL